MDTIISLRVDDGKNSCLINGSESRDNTNMTKVASNTTLCDLVPNVKAFQILY